MNYSFIESIQKLSRHVMLDEFKDSEIVEIICEKYPNFALASASKIAEKLIDIYRSLDFSSSSTNASLEHNLHTTSDESTSLANIRSNFIKEARSLSLRYFKALNFTLILHLIINLLMWATQKKGFTQIMQPIDKHKNSRTSKTYHYSFAGHLRMFFMLHIEQKNSH